ncbi:MAG TPA: hypothetical protein VIL35_08845 [Vicinamibacterales bacterium]
MTSLDVFLSRISQAASRADWQPAYTAPGTSSFNSQLAAALERSTPTSASAPSWKDFILGRNPSQYYDGLAVTPTRDVPAGYKPGPYRHQLEGFNDAKFDPSHPESMTMKMIAARIFEQFDVYSPTAIDDVVRAFNELGIPAQRVGIDQIDFNNGRGPIDVIRNKRYLEGDRSAGMAWTWLKGPGWKNATTPPPQTTTTTPTPGVGTIPYNPYVPSGGSVPFRLEDVTWLHEDVSSWAQTSTLTNVSVSDGRIELDHTRAGRWPVLRGSNGSADVEGNAWIFVQRNGRWYGATWEWLRPGQTTKRISGDELGAHIKREPLKSWQPQPGEQVGFMVSAPARDGRRTTYERSNIVMTTWPA